MIPTRTGMKGRSANTPGFYARSTDPFGRDTTINLLFIEIWTLVLTTPAAKRDMQILPVRAF